MQILPGVRILWYFEAQGKKHRADHVCASDAATAQTDNERLRITCDLIHSMRGCWVIALCIVNGILLGQAKRL